ncbi:MAG: sirohydrochlorin cobaltochelatase [Desulfobacteraceae bacterium]|nr:sirohydrochlorin cobaltochelatase [Desulfobacteraceae bacterium]
MKTKFLIPMAILILMFCSGIAFASPGKGEKAKKPGILLVAFGSSEASARVSFEDIEAKTRQACPDIPIFWAYSSGIIRAKLAKQGIVLDSPQTALAKMMDQGFTHVVVQSLQTIPGTMYDGLVKTVDGFASMGKFKKIVLGAPLLDSQKDMEKAVDAVLKTIPKDRKKGEAVVLMGHGTHHPANAFYAALMFQLQLKDPNIFVGTVEGYPEIKEIKTWLGAKKIKKAWLIPFMSVAGDHAKNDMAGSGKDSWQSILTRAGIQCKSVLKGTAEFDAFIGIWVAHIKVALHQI